MRSELFKELVYTEMRSNRLGSSRHLSAFLFSLFALLLFLLAGGCSCIEI